MTRRQNLVRLRMHEDFRPRRIDFIPLMLQVISTDAIPAEAAQSTAGRAVAKGSHQEDELVRYPAESQRNSRCTLRAVINLLVEPS
jgi:hypothetical protein